MKKLLKVLLNYNYWQDFKYEKRLSVTLKKFFKEEDIDLQDLFLKNFNYPSNMTEKPVRLSEDGDIYFVINFRSKELFENEGTIQAAFAQSISILGQQLLPLGITDYLTPEIEGRIEESYSILISVRPEYEAIKTKNIIINVLKHLIPTAALITILGIIL